jgi:hypothetical protein
MTSYPPRFNPDRDPDRFRLRPVRDDEPSPYGPADQEETNFTAPHYEEHPVRRTTLQEEDDIRNLSFFKRPDSRSASNEDEIEWQERQSPINFVLIIGILFVCLVVGWFGYRWYSNNTYGQPPVLQPDQGPFKVRPENPGGMVIPHQDKLVYGRLVPDQYQPVERLLPPPEQPLAPAGPDPYQQQYPAPYPQQQGYPQDYPQQAPQGYDYPPQNQGRDYGPAPYPQQQGYQTYPQHPQSYQQPYPAGTPAEFAQQPAPAPYPVQNQYQPYPEQPSHMGPPPQAPQPMRQQAAPTIQQQPLQQMVPAPVISQSPPQAAIPQENPLAPKNTNQEGDYDKSALDALLADSPTPAANPKEKATEVTKEEIKPSASEQNQGKTTPSTAVKAEGRYKVQVATFTNEREAQKERDRLKTLDPTLFKEKKFSIQKMELGSNKKAVYRVVVGSFTTANQAAQFTSRLKTHRIKGIVINTASN